MPASPATRRRVLRLPQVRAVNRAAVLQFLRRHQPLSRAELARSSGLSEAAVSRIVSELIDQRLVVAEGIKDGTGGRPAIRLLLNEGSSSTIGADVHNAETRISSATLAGRLLATQRFRTPPSAERALEAIAEQVGRHRSANAGVALEGVGISLRGLVNSDCGVLELGNNPQWTGIPVKAFLEERLGCPVHVDNTVRAAALAEYTYGPLEFHDVHCLLFVMVDEGVGMGIVLDGKLYTGPRMSAGEFGQMVIADSGGPERHDRPGCLEILASDTATCRRYEMLRRAGRQSSPMPAARIRRICQLAMHGDRAAREAIALTARYLGIGIANAVWALDPEVVVIDGALTEAWPLVQAAIQDQFPDPSIYPNFRSLMLRPSALGGEAAILGACTLPFAGMFS